MTRITFYDIIGTTPTKAWSPNTWKIRFVLNLKNIPYKTTWVEYPDIKRELSSVGIGPTRIRKDGTPYFTCPAIIDHEPKGGSADSPLVMADSFPIAKYLDQEYPNPPLFPHGTLGLQTSFIELWAQKLLYDNNVSDRIVQLAHDQLPPRSQEYFRETRERWYEKKLEEFFPEDQREEELEKARKAFDQLDKTYEATRASAKDGYLVLEGAVTWADICIASWLMWYKTVSPEEIWANHVAKWNDGRWETFVSAIFEKYGAVDHE